MKKIFIPICAFILLTAFSSCKKDWVCGCSGTSNEPGTERTTTYVTFTNAKKKDAKKACIDTKTEYESGGQTYVNTTACTLS